MALSTVLHAIGAMLIHPYLESILANIVEDHDRANFYAILTVFVMLLSSPAGLLGGWSYSIHSDFPFLIIVIGFLVSIGVMRFARS